MTRLTKRLGTLITRKCFFKLMATKMSLYTEHNGTVLYIMSSSMLPQTTSLRKSLGTQNTREWLLPIINSDMLLQLPGTENDLVH